MRFPILVRRHLYIESGPCGIWQHLPWSFMIPVNFCSDKDTDLHEKVIKIKGYIITYSCHNFNNGLARLSSKIQMDEKTVKKVEWMSNYMPYKTVVVITYPCPYVYHEEECQQSVAFVSWVPVASLSQGSFITPLISLPDKDTDLPWYMAFNTIQSCHHTCHGIPGPDRVSTGIAFTEVNILKLAKFLMKFNSDLANIG